MIPFGIPRQESCNFVRLGTVPGLIESGNIFFDCDIPVWLDCGWKLANSVE